MSKTSKKLLVTKLLFKFPDQLKNEWPEVFKDLSTAYMPTAFLVALRLEFNNGRIWEIDVADYSDEYPSISDLLHRLFTDYRSEIKDISVNVNFDKLKDYIVKSCNMML